MKRNSECERCHLCKNSHIKCQWGEGNPNAELFLVSDVPSYNGRLLMKDANDLLDHVLNKLGIDRDEIYISVLCKCQPLAGKLPTKKADREVCFDACWPYLEQEIKDVDPSAILLLGGTPLDALVGEKGITKHECMEVNTIYEGARTFAGFHPAYVLRSPSKEARLAQSIARAAKVAGIKIKTKGWDAGMFPFEVRM